ncbi:uncharacterized protein CC84DRAFT_1177146 [Paraphaeosphaeria sporulosa]|uniref:Uncharacterized protein n=1 Tax=Paraphaeosphaeria sporulosa TaxID=1460663 RepID=A0A177CBN0_9PLEO|nr:uncharacterized protein CC84DRAFT_1177146 [Paraphaeosphaeria sporulosa]OAG05025.1 hypothetical protein CC84DRAFT_1177146 [Paraphaeosphaeria sporulosa]
MPCLPLSSQEYIYLIGARRPPRRPTAAASLPAAKARPPTFHQLFCALVQRRAGQPCMHILDTRGSAPAALARAQWANPRAGPWALDLRAAQGMHRREKLRGPWRSSATPRASPVPVLRLIARYRALARAHRGRRSQVASRPLPCRRPKARRARTSSRPAQHHQCALGRLPLRNATASIPQQRRRQPIAAPPACAQARASRPDVEPFWHRRRRGPAKPSRARCWRARCRETPVHHCGCSRRHASSHGDCNLNPIRPHSFGSHPSAPVLPNQLRPRHAAAIVIVTFHTSQHLPHTLCSNADHVVVLTTPEPAPRDKTPALSVDHADVDLQQVTAPGPYNPDIWVSFPIRSLHLLYAYEYD